MESTYFIIENADPVYEQDSDDGANAERISLPVVAGPFDHIINAESSITDNSTEMVVEVLED